MDPSISSDDVSFVIDCWQASLHAYQTVSSLPHIWFCSFFSSSSSSSSFFSSFLSLTLTTTTTPPSSLLIDCEIYCICSVLTTARLLRSLSFFSLLFSLSFSLLSSKTAREMRQYGPSSVCWWCCAHHLWFDPNNHCPWYNYCSCSIQRQSWPIFFNRASTKWRTTNIITHWINMWINSARRLGVCSSRESVDSPSTGRETIEKLRWTKNASPAAAAAANGATTTVSTWKYVMRFYCLINRNDEEVNVYLRMLTLDDNTIRWESYFFKRTGKYSCSCALLSRRVREGEKQSYSTGRISKLSINPIDVEVASLSARIVRWVECASLSLAVEFQVHV